MTIIKNRANCQGKLWKKHTWGEYSYQENCLVCGEEKEIEDAGGNSAPLGLFLVILVILLNILTK